MLETIPEVLHERMKLHRSIPHSGRNSFDTTATDVSDREDPWNTGLKQVWRRARGQWVKTKSLLLVGIP
jgi:hypothetical protein